MKALYWVIFLLLGNVLFSSVFLTKRLPVVFPFAYGGNAEIRTLIVEEAKRWGVSTHLALALAKVESNYDPKAKNPKSSALGVYQWLIGSWSALCEGERADPTANTRCALKTISRGGLAHWLADPSVLPKLREEQVSDEVINLYLPKQLALK